jgi:hypothetical protein
MTLRRKSRPVQENAVTNQSGPCVFAIDQTTKARFVTRNFMQKGKSSSARRKQWQEMKHKVKEDKSSTAKKTDTKCKATK